MMNVGSSIRCFGKRSMMLAIVTISAVLCIPFAAVPSAEAQQTWFLNYPDFSNVDGLTLKGSAQKLDGMLRMTNSGLGQTGSAFASTPIDTRSSFTSKFQFKLHGAPAQQPPADGVAFVIQQHNPVDQGKAFYLGTPKSLAVEFDIYHNEWDDGNKDPEGEHVGVMLDGNERIHQATATPMHRLYDESGGVVVTAWIDYNASVKTLRIFTASTDVKPASALLSVPFDLTTIHSSSAFIGLTGQTGGFSATQDMLNWWVTVGDANVAPTVGTITAPLEPIKVNTAIDVSASFTDPDVLDTHTAVWGWGDGASSVGTVIEANGTGTASGSHTYTVPGVYTLQLTVQDKAGGLGESLFKYVVVYDPSAGHATGGGWIVPGSSTSESDDALPGLDGTSKANFGFVVKYKNGSSTVPGGNLEFHYNVGKFHLKSTAMDWLVVTNTNWAKFQGSATIDGTDGVYPFRVDARDGNANGGTGTDRFVIKIFKPGTDPNNADPIYKASADLLGGQIKIHQ